MRRLLLVAFLVLVASAGYRSLGSPTTATGNLTLAQPAPNVGQKAPRFDGQSSSGEGFAVSDEGVQVLTFWSTYNQGSDKVRPDFKRLARKYGDDGVAFAAVYVSGTPDEDEDVPYTVLRDPSGSRAALYNVKRVPRLFLIRDGEIRLVQDGYHEENEALLQEDIEDAIAEEGGDRSARRKDENVTPTAGFSERRA